MDQTTQVSGVGEEFVLKSSSVHSLVRNLRRAVSAKAIVLHCIISENYRHIQPLVLSVFYLAVEEESALNSESVQLEKENLLITRQTSTAM